MLGIIFSFSTNRQSRQKRVLTFHLDYFLMLSFLSLRAFFLKWKMREENIQLKTLPIPVAFLAAFDNATASRWLVLSNMKINFHIWWGFTILFFEDQLRFDMLFHASVSCHVTLCHAILCHLTSSHTLSCYVVSCTSCHLIPCHVVTSRHARHVTLCHVMSCHVMSSHTSIMTSYCHAICHVIYEL